jgi:hypothetical protein
MDGPDRLLVRGPGPPAGQQGIRTGDELRLQEQLREGRVGLVGAAVVQAHLGVAGQVELAGPIPVVDERDQANFRVVVRRDADGQAGLDRAVAAAEIGPVGVEREIVFVSGAAERLVADRPGRAIAEVADITELPPAVAGRVLAPAGHVQVPPGADPSPGGGDQNAVAAVGQQRDLGVRCVRRRTPWAGCRGGPNGFAGCGGHLSAPFVGSVGREADRGERSASGPSVAPIVPSRDGPSTAILDRSSSCALYCLSFYISPPSPGFAWHQRASVRHAELS